jgi:hypothetical protein
MHLDDENISDTWAIKARLPVHMVNSCDKQAISMHPVAANQPPWHATLVKRMDTPAECRIVVLHPSVHITSNIDQQEDCLPYLQVRPLAMMHYSYNLHIYHIPVDHRSQAI